MPDVGSQSGRAVVARAFDMASSCVYRCFGLWKAARVCARTERHDVCSGMVSERGGFWYQSMARDQTMILMEIFNRLVTFTMNVKFG